MNEARRRSRSPPRPSATDDDALVLRGKVEKLWLRPTTSSATEQSSYNRKYGAERNVVALVLLTRLEATHATRFLTRHPEIIPFCRQLVEEDNPVDESRTASSPQQSSSRRLLYARLVAQVIAVCMGEVNDKGRGTASRQLRLDLGSLLMQLLDKTVATMGPLTALDVDLAAALVTFLPACPDATMTDSILRKVWDRCATVLEHDPKRGTTPQHVSDPFEGKEPVTPDELLQATLTSILNQNSVWTVETTEDQFCGNLEWWEVQTGKMFVDHGCLLHSTDSARPSFFVPMLEWWLRRKKEPNESQRPSTYYSEFSSPSPWPHILLRCIQQNPNGFQDIGLDAQLARGVLQLVLACVINASADDNLRGQAWSAISVLVTTVGWDWMLQTGNPSSSALGRASKLCAVLRMASGEYKIQLNHRLYGSTGSVPAPSTGDRESDREGVAEECCRFLALSLQYIADVAQRVDEDEDDENDSDDLQSGKSVTTDPIHVPLSNAAILHIRKSLHEALMCSAQYCCELTSFGAEMDVCVVRLLGALLSEFDVFLETNPSEGDHGDDGHHHSILNALRVLLKLVHGHLDACESFLPGLLMILASSEGDDDRLSILKPYLADYVAFFEGWWAASARDCCSADNDNVNNLIALRAPSIECAWNVLELWHDAVVRTGVIVDVGGIQREILHFLSVVLDGSAREVVGDGSPPLVKAISAGVSSYLALQGDNQPCEPDASTIRRAVEVLQCSNVVA